MANNQLLASDSFASGSLAAGWTALFGVPESQIAIGSPNVAEPSGTTGSPSGQMWTALGLLGDQTSEVTIKNLVSEASTNVQLIVRAQAASLSGYYAVLTTASTPSLAVYVITSGSSTQLGSTVTGLTYSAGDVWSFQAAGCALTVYQNGERVFYFYDTTYLTGYPGFAQGTTTAVTHSQVQSWRGYNAVQQDGIWQKQGVVIAPIATDLSQSTAGVGLQSGNVIFDGNAQLLSGNVFKTWLVSDWSNDTASKMYYAESLDGISWTRRSSAVLSSVTNGVVTKVGSTYYMYGQASGASGSGNQVVYTSSDGITWTLQTPSSALGLGTSGAWDESDFYNLSSVVVVAGTWYGFYIGYKSGAAGFSTGLATSTDGITWTKYSGNPVIPNALRSGALVQEGSTWYMWCSANQPGQQANILDPFEIVRYSSTDLMSWSVSAHSIHHGQLFESVNSVTGGVFPVSIMNVGGKAYMWLNSSQGDSANPAIGQISLAIAPSSLASIVTQNEDAQPQVATDSFTSGVGSLDGNWTQISSLGALKIVSGNLCEAAAAASNCGAYYSGATFSSNQYSEITIQTLDANNYFLPVVRVQPGSFSCYGCDLVGPTGTVNPFVAGFSVNISGSQTTIASASLGSMTVQVGDKIRLAVTTGSDGLPVLSLYQNGFLIAQATDYSNSLTGGYPGIVAYAPSTLADAQISLWAGGNAEVMPNYSYSVSGNAGIGGATILYSGDSSGSTVADNLGNFSLSLANGNYVLNPVLSGYSFSPSFADITVNGQALSGIGFSAQKNSADIVVGFSPNWYEGQLNAGLGFYISSGKINGVQYNGQVYTVPANQTTYIWLSSNGLIQSNQSGFPSSHAYPIAVVVSGTIMTGTNTNIYNPQQTQAPGILSITDVRPITNQNFSF